ncbi:uncharacterized protein K452DRAFT_290148 [Aplosporella prunicola CBS 121167]|uniref:Uncharacterized protein n=1 Tax=Aplosporella prunicola CBS 121167 TaxID=1176127 RepID=A0A6A6B735_9PEZI|nr:uncharacterized protein K452DRAFT_290148 [Aplosporella prunicola CBS 121167]KAF2139045.1 hypothetical protein K452DRAFT_290148 [Aplosporella prunicola CBS 121167]
MPLRGHHRRTQSWPPLTARHLLSVAPIHFHLNPNSKRPAAATPDPLLDIDEDPFAHFLSPLTDEDNPLDTLSFSAGIVLSEPGSMKEKLRKKLARRWAKHVAKCPVKRNAETGHAFVGTKTTGDVPQGTDAKEPLPYHTVVREPRPSLREPTKGRAQELVGGGKRKRRKYRHSWRAPDGDLFTVVEEAEGGDSHIEQQYSG